MFEVSADENDEMIVDNERPRVRKHNLRHNPNRNYPVDCRYQTPEWLTELVYINIQQRN